MSTQQQKGANVKGFLIQTQPGVWHWFARMEYANEYFKQQKEQQK